MSDSNGYSNDNPHNDWIPVLTEVIAPGQIDQSAPAPPPFRMNPPAIDATPIASTTAQRLPLTEQEWEQLEQKLNERILRQLQSRIDFVLEQRIRDSLADVLQLAMIGLTKDIKQGLQQTLEDVIGRAVTQEITHLQTGKK
jgi:hypothetical protein